MSEWQLLDELLNNLKDEKDERMKGQIWTKRGEMSKKKDKIKGGKTSSFLETANYKFQK